MIAINTLMIGCYWMIQNVQWTFWSRAQWPLVGKSRTEKLCYCLMLRGSGYKLNVEGDDGIVTFRTGNKVEPWTIGTDTLKGVKHFCIEENVGYFRYMSIISVNLIRNSFSDFNDVKLFHKNCTTWLLDCEAQTRELCRGRPRFSLFRI